MGKYQEWKKIIDTNVSGVFLMMQAVLPLMKSNGWGRVINFGSAAVFGGVPQQVHYVAAKAGVVGLSRSLAMESGNYGITVNVATPGKTLHEPTTRNATRELIAQQTELRSLHPSSSLGKPLNVDGGKSNHGASDDARPDTGGETPAIHTEPALHGRSGTTRCAPHCFRELPRNESVSNTEWRTIHSKVQHAIANGLRAWRAH